MTRSTSKPWPDTPHCSTVEPAQDGWSAQLDRGQPCPGKDTGALLASTHKGPRHRSADHPPLRATRKRLLPPCSSIFSSLERSTAWATPVYLQGTLGGWHRQSLLRGTSCCARKPLSQTTL